MAISSIRILLSNPVPTRPLAASLTAARYLWALPNTAVGALMIPFARFRGGRIQVADGIIEAHGPLLAALLRRCAPVRGGAAAITFGHVVLGCDRRALDATRAHERVHVRQCEVWGPAFLPAYLLASIWASLTGAGAYEGNWFERQARAEEQVSSIKLHALRYAPEEEESDGCRERRPRTACRRPLVAGRARRIR